MSGWLKSILISLFLGFVFLAACGVKGPPADPSGPWGPQESHQDENGAHGNAPD